MIYVSNFPEGDTPREGYVEEIIEGLSEAYYSEEIIASYRKYLPTKIENVNAVAGNTEPVTELQPVDIKLTSEFRDIIKQEAVPVFSNSNREDAKSGCIKIFEALNNCFSRHS